MKEGGGGVSRRDVSGAAACPLPGGQSTQWRRAMRTPGVFNADCSAAPEHARKTRGVFHAVINRSKYVWWAPVSGVDGGGPSPPRVRAGVGCVWDGCDCVQFPSRRISRGAAHRALNGPGLRRRCNPVIGPWTNDPPPHSPLRRAGLGQGEAGVRPPAAPDRRGRRRCRTHGLSGRFRRRSRPGAAPLWARPP